MEDKETNTNISEEKVERTEDDIVQELLLIDETLENYMKCHRICITHFPMWEKIFSMFEQHYDMTNLYETMKLQEEIKCLLKRTPKWKKNEENRRCTTLQTLMFITSSLEMRIKMLGNLIFSSQSDDNHCSHEKMNQKNEAEENPYCEGKKNVTIVLPPKK